MAGLACFHGDEHLLLHCWACCVVAQKLVSVDRIVRCFSVLNVHLCKKSPKFAQMTFDRYLSNPDIGRTFWGGLT